jgi:hypothetical protein
VNSPPPRSTSPPRSAPCPPANAATLPTKGKGRPYPLCRGRSETVTELFVRSNQLLTYRCCSRGMQHFEQIRLDCIQHSQCAKMNGVEKGQVGKVSPATFRKEGSVCTHNVCEPATSRSASALQSWAGSFSMNRSLAALPRTKSKENKLCLRSKQTAASLPKSTCSL